MSNDHDRLVIMEEKVVTIADDVAEIRRDIKQLVRHDHYISAITIAMTKTIAILGVTLTALGLVGRLFHVF